jgi:hypothetical protein
MMTSSTRNRTEKQKQKQKMTQFDLNEKTLRTLLCLSLVWGLESSLHPLKSSSP